MKVLNSGDHSLEAAAAKAGMSENTARRYRQSGLMPTQMKGDHCWRTREDPFAEVAAEIERLLIQEPGLEAKTLFCHLQEQHPDRFSDGQLRSLQRRVKRWRAIRGAEKEVFFAQEHLPGDIGASDFCHAGRLRVTIAGQLFEHLLFHFVLTHSNWEFVNICFSESLESLSEGLQAALWNLGGVPKRHRTDSLSAAVRNMARGTDPVSRDEFTVRYRALIAHYGMVAEHTQPVSPNENGDVEQSHRRFLGRIDQALMLRGSREFASRGEYCEFLRLHCDRANRNRSERFKAEQARLGTLPTQPLDATKRLVARVSPGSIVHVLGNIYSVPSRLIGEKVDVVVRSEMIDVVYAQSVVVQMPRLRGAKGYCIDYRHVIDWLVRKPGAFDNYVYQPALFPTSRFRMAYDRLVETRPGRGKKEYLNLLLLAARRGESGVEAALAHLLDCGKPISERSVLTLIEEDTLDFNSDRSRGVAVAPVDLTGYDALIGNRSERFIGQVAMGAPQHVGGAVACGA